MPSEMLIYYIYIVQNEWRTKPCILWAPIPIHATYLKIDGKWEQEREMYEGRIENDVRGGDGILRWTRPGASEN